ncbi:MAG: DeoR/GlpR family DNA-binding transcription regulator [Beutenbergiaceae bacterium]
MSDPSGPADMRPKSPLPPRARRAEILGTLQRESSATTGYLAEAMGVSAVTIHRDLEALAREGRVVRMQGGAALPEREGSASQFTTNWQARVSRNAPAKDRIGSAARNLLEPGTTIFIDGSTTSLALAKAINAKPEVLTVVTDSPEVALAIQAREVSIILAPGNFDQDLRIATGRWTEQFLRELNYSAAFVSCAGADLDFGVTTTSPGVGEVMNAVFKQARSKYLLIDHSKFGSTALLRLAGLPDFDGVITDRMSKNLRQSYLDAGVKLTVARSG